ncbi:cystathionine beta-synthase (CBS) family protein [Klebsormidium nitens]|uniref:Cystathionine beta-synthase (CBS) family protein n=1 Tax=Klebsormidium nitens TaxID=105231 RepID=A0A0U9HJX6_KLENI|nr:cystathionine beta-synthase (CBS) family protein [Klebsormidium nitens]|eukprot:GAQ83989.1 cystathionine beta-synthase (CBS) family protein [Klebsormidium nitens]
MAAIPGAWQLAQALGRRSSLIRPSFCATLQKDAECRSLDVVATQSATATPNLTARNFATAPHADIPIPAKKPKDAPTAKMADVLKAMHKEDSNIISCKPDDLVIDAVRKMVNENIGALVVLTPSARSGKHSTVAGIVTERDYLRKIILLGRSSRETPVRDIMTKEEDLIAVPPESNVYDVMELMTEKRIRHMPIVEGPEKHLLGVVSIRDMLDTMVQEKKKEKAELQDYIGGSY